LGGEVQHSTSLDRVVEDGTGGEAECLELCLCDGVCQGVARRDVDQGGLGSDPLTPRSVVGMHEPDAEWGVPARASPFVRTVDEGVVEVACHEGTWWDGDVGDLCDEAGGRTPGCPWEDTDII